jgi:hypothetical protein
MARTDDWSVRSSAVRGWAGWAAGGLVVPTWTEDQVAEELTGGGVDDADVQVLDEEQDVGSGVGSADADVVQAAVETQGDGSGLADAVGAVVGVEASSRGCFGTGLVGGRGCGAWSRERCGRRWLYSSLKASSRVCSSVIVLAAGWRVSHFLRSCWNRSMLLCVSSRGCLKRYIAPEIFANLPRPQEASPKALNRHPSCLPRRNLKTSSAPTSAFSRSTQADQLHRLPANRRRVEGSPKRLDLVTIRAHRSNRPPLPRR